MLNFLTNHQSIESYSVNPEYSLPHLFVAMIFPPIDIHRLWKYIKMWFPECVSNILGCDIMLQTSPTSFLSFRYFLEVLVKEDT